MEESQLVPSLVHESRDQNQMSLICSPGLATRVWIESTKLWRATCPAIFTRISLFGLIVITQVFVGHIGDLELAAYSMVITVIWTFSFGLLLGMGSALETLCGQAYGAREYNLLGVYLQRSFIVLFTCSVLLSPFYIFASPILTFLGQSQDIADLAGVIAVRCIPLVFALGFFLAVRTYLQSQLKNMITAYLTLGALIIHILLSWLFVSKWGMGIDGALISLNLALWMPTVVQFLYVVCGGCPLTWRGFSRDAFLRLCSFAKLSLASGVMICVEVWYYTVLVLLAGHLSNPEIAIDSLSICMSINNWEMTIPLGFLAGISVRVSNELGAGNFQAAKFAVIVSVTTSFVIGLVICSIIFFLREDLASLFTHSFTVKLAVSRLSILLAFTILLNSVQPVLSGAAIGTGRQAVIAYVNIGCYYLVGVPLGVVLGYVVDLGVMGMWTGMICGAAVQTLVLGFITCRTDWKQEVANATKRIKTRSSQPSEIDRPLIHGSETIEQRN